MHLVVATILLVLLPSFALSQQYSAEERTILRLQDQRSIGDGKLIAFLSHSDARLRYRAAVALGNLQDTTTISPLLHLLRDSSPKVRAAAAFSLGQIGSSLAESWLLDRMPKEKDATALKRIIEALGKCGTEQTLSAFAGYRPSTKLENLNAEIALSVGRMAIRGIKSEVGVALCFSKLGHKNASVRWKALYALWRIAPFGPLDSTIQKEKKVLQPLITDKNGDVRMHLATLLGRAKAAIAFDLLQEMNDRETKSRGWRVQVQIARSLGGWAGQKKKALSMLTEWLKEGNEHVKIAALQGISSVPDSVVKRFAEREALRKQLSKLAEGKGTRESRVRGDAMVALAKYFPEQFTGDRLLADDKTTLYLKSRVFEALASIPVEKHLDIIIEHLAHDSVRLSMAAWESLRNILSPTSLAQIQKTDTTLAALSDVLFRKIKHALLRDDMAITTVVSQAVGDSSIQSILFAGGLDAATVEELMLTYTRLSSPADVEAMHALLETLGKVGGESAIPVLERALEDPDRTVAVVAAASLTRITGKDYRSRIPTSSRPLFTDYDWKMLESLPSVQHVLIITSKGPIKIKLMKDHAPFSVLSFVKLVRKGFYDGLTFHRVVPNFVIQGGDPRGDGWGGPGYSIRSEWSMVNYERGSVGLASAGKDTEGCQFFITHSPQPHLDGRYTIFATVVAGMDVVDKIHVRDTIKKIEFVK